MVNSIVAPMSQEENSRPRSEYEDDVGLNPDEMADDPMTQFGLWFSAAVEADIYEPDAFILSTASGDASPSARAVLLKELTASSLVFYTNLESRKSMEIKANPRVAATFTWLQLHRQVRFEGEAALVDDKTADAYFASRPRGAQIAAHASRQSRPVPDRETLERVYADLDAAFTDTIPRPAWWSGWEITPRTVEFWQGRVNRFHDRIRYIRHGEGWITERLQP
jgi:pyridoxamine 5'-phosphate oxidase